MKYIFSNKSVWLDDEIFRGGALGVPLLIIATFMMLSAQCFNQQPFPSELKKNEKIYIKKIKYYCSNLGMRQIHIFVYFLINDYLYIFASV